MHGCTAPFTVRARTLSAAEESLAVDGSRRSLSLHRVLVQALVPIDRIDVIKT